MYAPKEVAPGVWVVKDLLSIQLADEIVRAASELNPFRRTRGATLYKEVLLSNISPGLSDRFDAWLLSECLPLMEDCMGVRMNLFPPPPEFLERLGLRTCPYGPASRLERLLHLRGIRHRIFKPRLESSPMTFVTRYAEETQLGTGLHYDALAGASLVLVLNDGFQGGGTYFGEDDLTVSPPKGSGVIFSGRKKSHRGEPVLEGQRYITTTWFDVRPP